MRAYSRKTGGTIFAEVRVGESVPGAEHRSIDGVRLKSSGKQEIKRFKVNHNDFHRRLSCAKEVEVIEVKKYLGRYGIGQAIVAKYLLEWEYTKTKATPVMMCDNGDSLLEHICTRKLGIRVWTPRGGFARGKLLR